MVTLCVRSECEMAYSARMCVMVLNGGRVVRTTRASLSLSLSLCVDCVCYFCWSLGLVLRAERVWIGPGENIRECRGFW